MTEPLALTAKQLRLWIAAAGASVRPSSPLAALPKGDAESDGSFLHTLGLLSEEGRRTLSALVAPERWVRVLQPLPAATRVSAFYAGPSGEYVGFWGGDDERYELAAPWTPQGLVQAWESQATAADPFRVELSLHALSLLAAAIDSTRAWLFTTLLQRQPGGRPIFEMADLEAQLELGWEFSDARWLTTLLRLLSPSVIALAPPDLRAGFAEVAAAGLIETSGDRWAPGEALQRLAAYWRSPLPALAIESVHAKGDRIESHRHRVFVKGDGPLWVLEYEGLLENEPRVTLRSLDGTATRQVMSAMFSPAEALPARVAAPTRPPAAARIAPKASRAGRVDRRSTLAWLAALGFTLVCTVVVPLVEEEALGVLVILLVPLASILLALLAPVRWPVAAGLTAAMQAPPVIAALALVRMRSGDGPIVVAIAAANVALAAGLSGWRLRRRSVA